MTKELPSLLAPGVGIVPIIAFGRRFLVELPPRSHWLIQEMSEIFPPDGVIDGVNFYTSAGSHCKIF
jgi:hypothetical protein